MTKQKREVEKMYTYKANGNYTQEILENGNVLRTFETDVSGVYILAEYTRLKCGATLTAHYSIVAAKQKNFESRKSIKNDPIHGTYEIATTIVYEEIDGNIDLPEYLEL